MIFDTHTDVLYDVITGHHSFSYHLKEMKDYHGAVLNYFFKGNETYQEFQKVLKKIKDFYLQNKKILKEKHFILGIEGLGALQNLSDLKQISEAGIQIISLTWNDLNKLATGTYTNPSRGLKKFGKEILDYLPKYHIILDLSHLNRRSFYMVLKYYHGIMIVSHSNAAKLCLNERNLTEHQLEIIKQKNILVGVNSYKNFVGGNKDLKSFIRMIEYLNTKLGNDNVCLGLDFDYYLSSTTKSDAVKGLSKPTDLCNLKIYLQKLGYSEKDIDKLFYLNALSFFKSSLIL